MLKEGFTDSAFGYAVGKEGVEDLLKEPAVGQRAIWLCLKGAHSVLRMDGSKRFSGQSNLVSWTKESKIRLYCDNEDIVGLSFFNGRMDFRIVEGAVEALEKYGFHPNPKAFQEEVSSP